MSTFREYSEQAYKSISKALDFDQRNIDRYQVIQAYKEGIQYIQMALASINAQESIGTQDSRQSIIQMQQTLSSAQERVQELENASKGKRRAPSSQASTQLSQTSAAKSTKDMKSKKSFKSTNPAEEAMCNLILDQVVQDQSPILWQDIGFLN